MLNSPCISSNILRLHIDESTAFPEELNSLVISYAIDPIELLQKHQGNIALLSKEEVRLLEQAAGLCERLDFRGTHITWDNLKTLSPLFPKLRSLDLRNCPQLQPTQWDHLEFSKIDTLQGYKKIKELFSFHSFLTVLVHDAISILCFHGTQPDKDATFKFLMNGQPYIKNEARAADFDSRCLEPYLLSIEAILTSEYAELKINI
jgi:hypothetical protein